MGFHIILLKEANQIECRYVESLDKLAYISELQKNSIIYQAEAAWTPVQVGGDLRYQLFAEEWYRAGMKAQDVFCRQAREKGYMLEAIKQDQESFHAYTDVVQHPIKRSDFIIRNAKSIEVDVKCLTFYRQNGNRYFYLSQDDLEKHVNMSSNTEAPVLLAIYARVGDGVDENKLYMCEIGDLKKVEETLEVETRDGIGTSYKIPLAMTKSGFKLMEKYRNKAV